MSIYNLSDVPEDLRQYFVRAEFGLEPTLGEHLAKMVEVFEAVKRVLKPTGTLWVNYGDCYATSPNGRSAADAKAAGNDDRTFRDKPFATTGAILAASEPSYQNNHSSPRGKFKAADRQTRHDNGGRIVAGGYLKAKDLCMVPNRFAIAMQDAGWWVRAEIIWGKPNPMPSSIKDRPATSHEKIFMFTKSARYAYDHVAVRQTMAESSGPHLAQDVDNQRGSSRAHAGAKTNGTMKAVGGRGAGRNLRNYEPAPIEVWEMATQPFKESHFATFPAELARRAILAGCPKYVCSSCGAPWERQIQKGDALREQQRASGGDKSGNYTGRATKDYAAAKAQNASDVKRRILKGMVELKTSGFSPTCTCDAPAQPGLVLDPFGGAGTTALVALRLGRRAQIIELSPEYSKMARRRIEAEWHAEPKQPTTTDYGPLFQPRKEEISPC